MTTATKQPAGEALPSKYAGAPTRAFTAVDQSAAVEVMVRAFFDDPAFVYVFRNPETRAARMRWLGERWLRARRVRDDLLVTDPVSALLVGVRPGGDADISFWAQVKLGLVGMPFVFGLGACRRFLAVDGDVKKRHREELTTPHFIVDVLAVDPPGQGQKLGTRLLHTFLEHADRERQPAYLITTKASNVPFYERADFQVIREAPIAPDGPTGWSMRRERRG